MLYLKASLPSVKSASTASTNPAASKALTRAPTVSAQAPCALRVADEALSFAACQDLSTNLATGYSLLYTLSDNGNGTSTLAGAFDRPASAPAWAAFGLPRCQQDVCGMLHGSAVIARTCASCPTGMRSGRQLPAQLPACADQECVPVL